METLDGTEWDVLISGTGLQESLLALSLSRSGKSVLHIDCHNYYGGSEAALSLQEAEEFARDLVTAQRGFFDFTDVKLENQHASESEQLSFSRAYTLALTPAIIYAKSPIIGGLVDSQLDSQLEFLAVGRWFKFQYDREKTSQLFCIPSSREEIFTDQNLTSEDKRKLMKFLRFMVDFELRDNEWANLKSMAFDEFLATKFHLNHPNVVSVLQALALSPANSSRTTTGYALARIARHLRSYRIFGSNFSAVIPRWGGLSEISQVSCRASAVAGSVYMLGNGVSSIRSPQNTSGEDTPYQTARLDRGESVRAKNIVCSSSQAPSNVLQDSASSVTGTQHETRVSQMISIVTSTMETLFPPLGENAPIPACAVVVVDPTSDIATRYGISVENLPSVHMVVHSSDTGECPAGQSIIYSNIALERQVGYAILSEAVEALVTNISPSAKILWQLKYERLCPTSPDIYIPGNGGIQVLAPISAEAALEDDVLSRVRLIWQHIVGPNAERFLLPPEASIRGSGYDEFSEESDPD